MKKSSFKISILSNIITTFIVLVVFVLFTSFSTKYFEVSKQLDIFSTLFKELNIYYVDDTQPEKLMTKAINSMLETLDPYTTYMSESEAQDFNVQTTGEYAGIGASIKNGNNEVVIVDVYNGFAADKAGLKAGDIIRNIDELKVNSDKPEEISVALRGSIGSDVNIVVSRPTIEEDILINVKREKIILNAVPYFGVVKNDVGYIVLNSFSRKASIEVEQAFFELKSRGIKSLILDLRGNPGGLLTQSVDVSNLFLPVDTKIVETKGRLAEWNNEYYTADMPIDTEMPIAVLTDFGTASAAEIVAGSFQDLDRAVVIGSRTFGKGLVQQPRMLSYGTQLKLTIAKYHIPSGRCVQARDYSHKDVNGVAQIVPDSLRNTFYTKNGRKVFDGAGICPDIKIEEVGNDVVNKLSVEDFIFDYSVMYCNKLNAPVSITDFELTDAELNDFKNWLNNKEFVYKSETKDKFTELKEMIAKDGGTDEISHSLIEMEHLLNVNDKDYFDKNITSIKERLELNIVRNFHHDKGLYSYNLSKDKAVNKAISLLNNKKEYNKILGK
ncbi:MAG: S41 family peptidase [Ichthyobacteriaceae bacterium]|nr:S41 family peptidase [Ichthyobacteriaceae bacterium]